MLVYQRVPLKMDGSCAKNRLKSLFPGSLSLTQAHFEWQIMVDFDTSCMCPCDQTMSNGSFQQPQHLWPSKLPTPGKNISSYNKNKQFAGPIKITKIYHVAGDFTAPFDWI